MENQEQADADIFNILVHFKNTSSKWYCLVHDELRRNLRNDGTYDCESCFMEHEMKAEEFLGVAEEDKE